MGIGHIVKRAVGDGVACRQHLFFRQIDKAIAARVRPSEEVEFHAARAVIQHERRRVESLLRRLGRGAVKLLHIFAIRLHPTLGLVTLHLLRHPDIGQRRRAHFGPDGVSVGVVAVVVRVENVLDGLAGKLLRVGRGQARAGGEVGVDDDEIVLHLNDDVIAMPLLLDVAFAEPNAGYDLLNSVRLRGYAGREEDGNDESGKAAEQENSATGHERQYTVETVDL